MEYSLNMFIKKTLTSNFIGYTMTIFHFCPFLSFLYHILDILQVIHVLVNHPMSLWTYGINIYVNVNNISAYLLSHDQAVRIHFRCLCTNVRQL